MAKAIHQPYPTITLVLDYDEADLIKLLLIREHATNPSNYVAGVVYNALAQS